MVSVIVPVYNVRPYLKECIDSILAQSYRQMEIILIDDGSTDGSGEFCDAYAQMDNRIHVIHQPNQGLSAARNCGIEYASGEYLCFVDSDDYLYPYSIETLLRLCVENKADMSVCTFDMLNGKKHIANPNARTSSAVEVFYGEQKMDAYLRQNKIHTTAWGKMFAAELFHEIRFPVGKLYEDVYILHRILHEARCIAYLPKSTYIYRIRPGSITNSGFSLQSMDMLEAHTKLFRFVEERYPELLPYAQANMMCIHITLLFMIFNAKASYPALEKQLRDYCRAHFTVYMKHGNSKKRKLLLPILCVSLPLAKFLYRLYLKLKAPLHSLNKH